MEPEASKDSRPPEPKWSSQVTSVFAWAQQNLITAQEVSSSSAEALAHRQRLEQDLAAARAELAAMHELLEDIPQIFERKFQQRLQGILEDNTKLRRQLQQLQGSPEPEPQWQLSPARRIPRIRKSLGHAFGLPASRPPADGNDDGAQAA